MIYRASLRLSSGPGVCVESTMAVKLKVMDSSCGIRNVFACRSASTEPHVFSTLGGLAITGMRPLTSAPASGDRRT
jgi:hypothetical protein